MSTRLKRFILAVLVLTILLGTSVDLIARAFDTSAGGTTISNRAEASYQDEAGETFTTVSTTVTITVLTVAKVVVTPDETAPSETISPRERVNRLFTICNSGNSPDSFTITGLTLNTPASLNALYLDNDASGSLTNGDAPVTINVTSTPQLQPAGCFGVLAVIDTNDAATQSLVTIGLTARSNATNTANGQGQDIGTIINVVGLGARLTDPTNPNLPPTKLVDGETQKVVSTGSQFTYTITFRNSGDVVARNVVLDDPLPAGIEYVSNSLQLNDRSLTDALDADEGSALNNAVRVRLDHVNPDEVVRVSLRARLTSAIAGGTGLANHANIVADNVAPRSSAVATVIVDPFGVVFSGRAGSAAPIPGARVEVLVGQSSDSFLQLPADSGFSPNGPNANPFSTDGQGHYSFAPGGNQIGSSSSAATYQMRVSAAGYLGRMIELTLTPAQAGLFSLNAHALDNQPLAVAGGFDLVREDVRVSEVAALALNIPMFEPSSLQIVKSVDRARADIGDIVTYRVEIHNPTAATISNVVVRDHLPPSFHYASGSGLVSVGSSPDRQIEPQTEGEDLLFNIGDVPHGVTAHLTYRVRIGVNSREGLQENLAVASGAFPSGEHAQSPQARAGVYVSGGVFSSQQFILGRVFVDTNHNGQFDSGDRPVPGVRLYLSNGQSVITDSGGLYNFPSLGDGSQVISLDPVSVPAGYALSDGGKLSGKSWTRLLRTPVGGGGMLRQNFALVSVGRTSQNEKTPARTENQVGTALSGNSANSDPREGKGPAPQATSAAPDVLPSTDAGKTAKELPRAAGTYELVSTETVEPVPAGNVLILSPKPSSVVMTPGLQLEARVAENWSVKVELNGEEISEKNIGVRSLDHKNQVSTFTYVGLNVRPGPNRIRCTAISPEGKAGRAEELTVMGRGPARRLEIVTDKPEIQTGGNDSTIVRVKAFDQWGNPALDGQVGVEASLGQLSRANATPGTQLSASTDATALPEQTPVSGQLVVQLEGGEASIKLVSSGAPGESRLRAQTGDIQAENQVHVITAERPTILVGFAEMSFGKSIPEVALRGEAGKYRNRVGFFFNGRLPGNNMLTLAYDSQRPINRTAGRDRLFQLDPLDRMYPLFGDSSTRYEAAQSNSKLYVRVDHKRSYVMFGDFEADMEAPLAGYGRRLTGIKAHFENSQGDSVTVGGARPDTAFARDIFPGGALGIMQLSHGEILPGSEVVVIELRDRRNPEVILSRETLARSIDYNLDAITGQLFMLRYISTFDIGLNLMQVVVTYEHRAIGMGSTVYTARARKNFKRLGLKLGLSTVWQNQTDARDFFLGGIDAEKTLPRGGSLQFAWARSQGQVLGTGNVLDPEDSIHNGNAYQITLTQPLPFYSGVVKARYQNASAGFFNPFGGTVTPGSRRGEVTLEIKPLKNSILHFGVTNEQNRTENVDNSRMTYSAGWDQIVNEKLKLHFAFDHRSYVDDLNNTSTDSNLITAGADLQLTEKLQLSVKREQNLGDADPTYPSQTTLAASYQLSALTKLFLSQRFASGAITPIGDYTGTGFAAVTSRRETAFGVETRFGKYTSMVGRYQLENGINGTDSFAVIGLQNRLPVTKKLALELGFERGFHLAGPSSSFNSATVGFGWQPNSDFRASARYEYRDRNQAGQLFAAGAAGRLKDGITTLARVQWARGGFNGRTNSSMEGTVALAIRPLESDRAGLLFNYTHRSLMQDAKGPNAIRDRSDSLSTDGYFQATKRLEFYGRFALRLNANGQPHFPYVSTLSFLTQARAQYQLTRRFDWAVESRVLFQPSSKTRRTVYATEVGFWALPDLRLAVGYNMTNAIEPGPSSLLPSRRGFYFNISSKLSNLFDLFGTSKAGLQSSEPSDPQGSEAPKR